MTGRKAWAGWCHQTGVQEPCRPGGRGRWALAGCLPVAGRDRARAVCSRLGAFTCLHV